jgi:hypothetical protein
MNMSISLNQPDGLHLPTSATLAQLLEDEPLHDFANGLLHAALRQTCHLLSATCRLMTLAQALHHPGPEIYPMLTALLALDAEVRATLGDEVRVMPLPGFLSYRASLPPDKVPLHAVRLPRLNQGGHYRFVEFATGEFAAVRFDLHPELHLAGHMRLVLSSPTRFPVRLFAAEERLDRKVLTEQIIEEAMDSVSIATSPPLTLPQKAGLVQTFTALWRDASASTWRRK